MTNDIKFPPLSFHVWLSSFNVHKKNKLKRSDICTYVNVKINNLERYDWIKRKSTKEALLFHPNLRLSVLLTFLENFFQSFPLPLNLMRTEDRNTYIFMCWLMVDNVSLPLLGLLPLSPLHRRLLLLFHFLVQLLRYTKCGLLCM